jgi:hypothetical protein
MCYLRHVSCTFMAKCSDVFPSSQIHTDVSLKAFAKVHTPQFNSMSGILLHVLSLISGYSLGCINKIRVVFWPVVHR